jgi:tripartite ATP-independent transporter DctM subunit
MASNDATSELAVAEPANSELASSPDTRRVWRHVLPVVVHAAEALIVAAILAEMVATIGSIVSRHFFNAPLAWTDDLSSICLNLIAFLGGAVAVQRGRGMSLDLFVQRMSPRLAEFVRAAGIWAALIFFVRVLMTTPDFLRQAQISRTPNLRLPTTVSAIWVPVGCVLLMIFLIDQLLRMRPNVIVRGGVVAAAGTALVFGVGKLNDQGILAIPPIVVLAVVFACCLIAAVPIGIVIGAAALAFIQIDGTISFATVPVALQSGISSFVLLAIPFFMLAGVLMDAGGLASRLVAVITPIVRRLPGGLLVAQVLSVYVFSGISGSKTADIAAVGSVMRRPLAEAGYPPEESTAVLASAAAMSETVPPSLAIIILASITSLSPATLFLAGIVPAAAMAAVLVAGITIRGRGGRYPSPSRLSIVESVRALPPALPALVLPVILVYGIAAGIGTSTEVSAVAALYGLVVVAAGYRSLRLRDLWRSCADASVLGGLVLFIIANATVLSQALTINQIPQHIASALGSVGGKTLFMVLSVITLVLLGMLLEGLPAIVVFAPLLLPVATTLHINSLQYGIVLLIAMGIGSFAPPIGAGLYVAAAIGETSITKVMRPAWFYTAILLVGILIIAVVPSITTALPSAFGRG